MANPDFNELCIHPGLSHGGSNTSRTNLGLTDFTDFLGELGFKPRLLIEFKYASRPPKTSLSLLLGPPEPGEDFESRSQYHSQGFTRRSDQSLGTLCLSHANNSLVEV